MPCSIVEESSNKPSWLSEQYVQDALRKYIKDNSLEIVKLEIVPASSKGDNYCGVMTRVRVQFTSDECKGIQSGSYVLKSTLEDAADSIATNVMEEYNIYNHELEMYGTIFPKFRDILATIGYREDLVPRTVTIDYDHKSIFFEDLTARGFLMPNVKKGFNAEHAKMILSKVAKMHAASVLLDQENPKMCRKFDRGIFNKHNQGFTPFFAGNFEVCARMVRDWEGYEVYGEKLMKLVPKFMEYGTRAMEPRKHHFNVLTHGDLWCNNTMFKYNDKGEPVDVVLLDFQFSCWASPTVDLHYFLNSSLVEDLRFNHIEEFVHFYYLNLRKTLEDLAFQGKIPTLQQFWMEYMETAFYALFTLTITQPVMLNEIVEDASLNRFLEGNTEKSMQLRYAIFSNPKVQDNLRRLLPVFDRRGLLDLQS
ncbi:unnamed protein product [Hermetia illucens]|uniref:CHK kinase-like domain-containing protein n=1 Tax=Hermetia illucens TaxID=343691 RepID=A0A7R8V2X2_HERIL|nr:uncharacterized protein LOC119659392 [Hermetia illucens]CAD7091876.1 unnamed protein product [Hermetia illucens]